jgi:hypothetical protein
MVAAEVAERLRLEAEERERQLASEAAWQVAESQRKLAEERKVCVLVLIFLANQLM